MSAALALPATPTVAALRADLAAAVSKHAAARDAADKLARAARDADSAVIDAFAATERAREAAAKAGAIDADELAAAVLAGKPATGTGSRREARATADDADDRLTEARAIRDGLNRKAEEARTSLSFASDRARTAALAVVQATSAANIAAFITETARLQVELQDRLGALAWLRCEHLVPFLDPTISAIVSFRLVVDPGTPTRLDPASTAGRWESMVAALSRDSKAPASIP